MQQEIILKENIHSGESTIKMHHHSLHQILYVIEDECEIVINKEKKTFTKDDLAFIPPYAKHSTISDTDVTVLELNFDINRLDPALADALTQSDFDKVRLIHLNPFEAGSVRQLLRRMLYEQSQKNPIRSLILKNYLEELLLRLITQQEQSTTSDANELRAVLLKEYIDTHYFEINDVNDFSKQLGISTRHVNTIFKDQYQMTPMQYLNQVRINTAKKLLVETQQNVAAICFEVGYESVSTFYRHFKRHTKLSPNEFRLKYKYAE